MSNEDRHLRLVENLKIIDKNRRSELDEVRRSAAKDRADAMFWEESFMEMLDMVAAAFHIAPV